MNLFEQYIEKIRVISSGFADMLLSSTTRDDIQSAINAKNMYLIELDAYDRLVEKTDELNNKVEFAKLRDEYLDSVIKVNNFEIYKEELKEKNNTK